MRGRWMLRRAWLLFLFAATGLLLLSLAYGQHLRRTYLPDELRYIPPETFVLIAFGDIDSLWAGIENQLGPAARESEKPGPVGDLLEDLRAYTRSLITERARGQLSTEEGKAWTRDFATDLERIGLDIERGVLLAGFSSESNACWKKLSRGATCDRSEYVDIVVLPVSDQALLLSSLEATEIEDSRCGGPCHEVGTWTLVFPENDVALLVRSNDALVGALRSQAANLRYNRARQGFYAAARRYLRAPLLRGPRALVFYDASSATLPIQEVAVTAAITPAAIRLEGGVDFRDHQIRALDELLTTPPPEAPGRSLIATRVPGLLLARDGSLGRYLRFTALNEKWENALGEQFGGLLAGASPRSKVTQVLQTLTGIDDGLAQGLLTIWSDDPDELDDMVERSQRLLRTRRRESLLDGWKQATGAASASGPATPMPRPKACTPSERYAGQAPEPEVADGSTGRYEARRGGETIRYLAPPLTCDDLLYRLTLSKPIECCNPDDLGGALSVDEKEVYLGSRWRLASWRSGNTLWVASDELDLHQVIDQAGPDPAAPGPGTFPPTGGALKLQLMVDIPATFDEYRLGEGKGWKTLRRALWDVRFHTSAFVRVSASQPAQRLRFDVEWRR